MLTKTAPSTRPVVCLVAFLVGVVPGNARAQAAGGPATPSPGSAEALFEEAESLSRQGNFAGACPKYVASHRLEPAGGAILLAAACHERLGTYATALNEFKEALELARRDKRADRQKFAQERIAVLEGKVGKLTLIVASEQREHPGFVVEIDGVVVPSATLSDPIAVDKGGHTLVARAPGRKPWSVRVSTSDGLTIPITIPDLAPEATSAAPSTPSASSASSAEPAAKAERDAAAPGTTQRLVAFALGGLGAVGLGVGSYFGIRAMSIGDQSGKCTGAAPRTGCPEDAVADQRRARDAATASTISFAAGGVLAAAGVVLYVTAPRGRAEVVPTVAHEGAGVMFRGSF